MKSATDTRDASFHTLKDVGPKQMQVYDVIVAYGPLCDRRIAARLGWTINRVTGRRNELLEMRLIADAGKQYDAATNRWVHSWIAVEPEILF